VVYTDQLGAGGAVGRLKSTGVHTTNHEFFLGTIEVRKIHNAPPGCLSGALKLFCLDEGFSRSGVPGRLNCGLWTNLIARAESHIATTINKTP
jgi:hypothetical protein